MFLLDSAFIIIMMTYDGLTSLSISRFRDFAHRPHVLRSSTLYSTLARVRRPSYVVHASRRNLNGTLLARTMMTSHAAGYGLGIASYMYVFVTAADHYEYYMYVAT